MPQTGTANLTDFEPGNASATASLDEFQPELLPEVKQAIAAVPRPKFQPPAPSLTQRLLDTSGTPQPQLPSSVKEFSERLNEPNHPVPGAFEGHPENIGEYVPRTIGRVAKAVPRLVNYRNQPSSETAKAATDIVSGAGEAALPFAPFSVAAAPLSTAVGFGAGALASEGAGKVAHGKVSPETEELIRSLAFWAPGVAGQLAGIHGLAADTQEGKAAGVSAFGGRVAAGAKITPEEAAFGAKVGPFKGTVRIPRTQPQAQPAIEPPTIEGQVAPQVPHPGAPVDNMAEGASNTVAMANEEAQAMRMVSGLPPTPPPPPVPPPPGPPIPPEIANGHISPETVQKIGEMIAKVPPALRAQATLEAHQTLSQSILQQGKVVTPDGTLEIVTKPEQADKVAQRIINDEVKRQEKILAEQTNESGPVGVGVATTETAPLSKIEQALRARRARKVDQEQATPIAPAPVVPRVEQPEEPQGNNIGTATLHDFTPQSSSPAVPAKTEGGTAALADLAPTNFLKGDQVVLPDGVKAKVSWVSQKMSIAVEAAPSSEDAKSIRQRAPVVGQQGSDTTLNTANGNLPAKYRVVEVADLLPSHNPQTFGRNADYPEGIQERTYDTSKEAQARVIQQAQNYDPNYTINTNPDAVNGPPIITPDGTVLGGNSRAMSTQRLYKAGKGELYKEALLARAQTFGLDKEAIRLMKEPVLVREVAHPESLEATRRLASDLNKSMTGTLGVSERAVSAGKSITRDSLAKVAAMMDDIGADASLRDLMRERGRDLVSLLVKDGVITERERPQFVETATGGLSEEGKTFVERALLGSVVDDPRLMDSTPKAVLNKLDGSLAALSSLSPRTDPYNILPLVRAALHDHAEIASLGSNVETFLNQSGLFGGDRSPAVDAMTRLLAERPTVVKQKFRQFAQDAGFDVQGQATLGLMEAVGPVKAFNDAFGTNLTEEALADSIVRAAQIDPIIGGSREAGIPGSTETSARGVQQRPAGEARPGSEAGAGAPTQGKSQPKTGNQLDLLADESGSFEPGKLAAPVAELFKQDVAPALGKAGVGLRDTAALFIKGFYPRIEESNPVGRWLKAAAPSDAVDELMRLKGDRAKALANFDGVMSGMEKMFDHLPEEARIDFIHRIQTGAKQPSTELQQIANLFKQVQDIERSAEQDAMNLGRKGKAVELSHKENYFHNWWSTPPGTDVAEDEETRVSRLSSPRRPLEGSRGYNKRQSYTLKEGIAAGGKPETTNPVRIMRHRIEDGLKFVTARKAWQGLHDLDLRTFVGQGERPPAGFDKVDDRIARVYFPAESGEGTIKAGEWYVEANTARLLNNMLSRDLIRGNAAGRSLMWLKNASTALELGLSPFHAVFETIEAASSQLALGMQRSFNLGIRGGNPTALAKGIYEMATSPVAPITMAREGAALPAYIEARSRLGEIGITQFGKHQIEGNQPHGVKEAIAHFGEVRKVAGIRRLLLQYPDLDQLVDDMFTGGLIIGQHRDYQTRAFGKTAAEAWSAGNHLGAMLRAGIGLPQTMMKPLFQWYIPNLKYSLFLKQMSEQAAEHAAELEDGSLTRATLARRVADSVENRFGELNFDNLFLRQTVKTALQFLFRSVTYKLGTVREFAGAAGGQAAELANWARQAYDSEYRESAEAPGALPRLDMRASWVAALILTTVAMGAIASKLLSGKYPWEYLEEDNKEGSGDLRHLYLETVHPRTGEMDSRGKPVRISLPTYWKDVEHASSNPSQYVLSSLSTALSKGMDLAENRDYFGNYVYNPNASLSKKIEQAGKYAFPTPFAVSNYQRGQQMGEPKTAWLSAFGFPRAPSNLDFTPAERLAQSLLKAREAPHTPEEMEAWSEKRQAFEKGQLSPAAARSFVKQQRESYLERQFKHLQYTEAVKVYGVATEQEKPLLNRLLREKRQNLIRRHATIPPGSD